MERDILNETPQGSLELARFKDKERVKERRTEIKIGNWVCTDLSTQEIRPGCLDLESRLSASSPESIFMSPMQRVTISDPYELEIVNENLEAFSFPTYTQSLLSSSWTADSLFGEATQRFVYPSISVGYIHQQILISHPLDEQQTKKCTFEPNLFDYTDSVTLVPSPELIDCDRVKKDAITRRKGKLYHINEREYRIILIVVERNRGVAHSMCACAWLRIWRVALCRL